MSKIIYFHGFGSSGASGTVQLLRRSLPDFDIVAPDIPLDPRQALPFLKELCAAEQPDIIVGTSMGGMYAQQMRGYKRLIVNPAFWMSRMSQVLKPGTFTYQNKRRDKQMTARITKDIILAFAEMEKHQFEGMTEQDTALCYAMFGKHDPTVHTYDTFVKYYPESQASWFDGEHRINDLVMKHAILPKIEELFCM
ncbi:MAG: hypothetical protein MJY71_07190 [Bacteroidaceae bacterium]|nr:hypothetical protein [Bacteroidaceae bacterium]